MNALRSFNGVERAAVLMMLVGEEEAAAILGVPAGTVKSRCARGRARLALLLRGRRGDG